MKTRIGLTTIILTALAACGNENSSNTREADSGHTTTDRDANTYQKDSNNIPDASQTDAETQDSGNRMDATTETDASEQDSGTNDGGIGIDGSTPDASTTNRSPTLDFPYTRLSAQVGRPIEIIMEGRDPDGDELEYKFEHGDGTIEDWAIKYSTLHAYAIAGNYNLIAYARDNRGGQTSKTIEVIVGTENVNNPPVVRLKCITDPTDDLADCERNADGVNVYRFDNFLGWCWDFTRTYDPDGDELVEYTYIFNSDINPPLGIGSLTRPKICGGYRNSGTYNGRGEVWDSRELKGETPRTINIIIERN